MSREIKTIYELFSDFQENDIEDAIKRLSNEEKSIIKNRYGTDLHNPITTNWDSTKSSYFYKNIIPKIRTLLNKDIINITDDIKLKDETRNSLESTNTLIEFIRKGKTNKEICKKFGWTSKKLYRELLNLKRVGININKRYSCKGNILYEPINKRDLSNKNSGNNINIESDKNRNSFKFLAISDLHFGNYGERLDLVDRAFNYCIKNNINIILCGGDMIDGLSNYGTRNISDPYKQVEHFINKYPHDDSILTFGVGGNHDYEVFQRCLIDLIEVCKNYRHDIIIGGYGESFINIKNDNIELFHNLNNWDASTPTSSLVLEGHHHQYFVDVKNNYLNIGIPPLSNVDRTHPFSSALELELNFKSKYIDNVYIKQIYFDDKTKIISSFSTPVNSNKVLEKTK